MTDAPRSQPDILRKRSFSENAPAALILAAGRSSRMGCGKMLLPLGSSSVLGQAVARLQDGGARPVVVVTGHHREAVEAEARRFGCSTVSNPDPEGDMFSSLRVGLTALPPKIHAVLVLPGDNPLVRPSTCRALSKALAGADVAVPTFLQRGGHPVLLGRRALAAIPTLAAPEGLRSVLSSPDLRIHRQPVPDSAILRDADTPEDFAALEAYAAREEIPTDEEMDALLDLHRTPQEVRRHGQATARAAQALGEALVRAGTPLDLSLLRAAALLHDIAKGSRRHAEVGGAFLASWGFAAVGSVVALHMDLAGAPPLPEAEVLYLADKMLDGERLCSLEERRLQIELRFREDPKALRGALARLHRARELELRMNTQLATPVFPLFAGALAS